MSRSARPPQSSAPSTAFAGKVRLGRWRQYALLALSGPTLLAGMGCHREVEMIPLIDRKIAITDRFYDVAALGPEEALVVGYGGKILRTEDGGASWSTIPSHTKRHALYSAAFADATHGWIVGQDGLILHTTDGGKIWQRQNSGTDRYLFSVTSLGRDRAWAVGDRSILTETTDGGKTWRARKVEVKSDDRTGGVSIAAQDPVFYDVAFLNATTGWISGEFGKLLYTEDAGATWTEHQQSLMGEEFFDALDLPTLFGLHFINQTEGYAAGLDARIAHTSDGGTTWSWAPVKSTYPLLDPFFSVRLFDDGSGWAVGAAGQVVRREAGQTVWQTADLGQPVFTWLRGMSFLNQQNGWLVGGYGLILHTTDGGKTWLPCFG